MSVYGTYESVLVSGNIFSGVRQQSLDLQFAREIYVLNNDFKDTWQAKPIASPQLLDFFGGPRDYRVMYENMVVSISNYTRNVYEPSGSVRVYGNRFVNNGGVGLFLDIPHDPTGSLPINEVMWNAFDRNKQNLVYYYGSGRLYNNTLLGYEGLAKGSGVNGQIYDGTFTYPNQGSSLTLNVILPGAKLEVWNNIINIDSYTGAPLNSINLLAGNDISSVQSDLNWQSNNLYAATGVNLQVGIPSTIDFASSNQPRLQDENSSLPLLSLGLTAETLNSTLEDADYLLQHVDDGDSANAFAIDNTFFHFETTFGIPLSQRPFWGSTSRNKYGDEIRVDQGYHVDATSGLRPIP